MNLRLDFQTARLDELPAYLAFSQAGADADSRQRTCAVPPGRHDEFADAMRRRIEAGSLVAVRSDADTVAFFNLEPLRSKWWPADDVQAIYLAGIVVSSEWSGRGIGSEILRWCVRKAARQGFQAVRLDCHAGNPWLRQYYESHGFTLRGFVAMHPGYDGCLYELGPVPAEQDPP